MTRQRALFLDRDGTLVHPFHYPSQPEHLRLYNTIGSALWPLQRMGFLLIVITNQAGIARGYFREEDLLRMHTHLRAELAQWDVRLNAIYHCPHHPDGVIPELAIRCDCRKPQPGMLLRAATEHDLDLSSSWFVGDILDDIEAGNRAGCRTVLVDLGTEQMPSSVQRRPTFVARDSIHALSMIRSIASMEPDIDFNYRPASWQNEKDAAFFSEGKNLCSQ